MRYALTNPVEIPCRSGRVPIWHRHSRIRSCVGAYALVRMRWCVCVGAYALVRMRWCVCVGAYALVRMCWCVCVGAYALVHMPLFVFRIPWLVVVRMSYCTMIIWCFQYITASPPVGVFLGRYFSSSVLRSLFRTFPICPITPLIPTRCAIIGLKKGADPCK
jgi:hypothetical protein